MKRSQQIQCNHFVSSQITLELLRRIRHEILGHVARSGVLLKVQIVITAK